MKNLPDNIRGETSVEIEKYTNKKPNTELLELIIQGGIFSRFYVDPRIGRERYEQLHKLWMNNSVKDNTIFVVFF